MDKKSRNTIIVSIVALAIVLITVTYAYFSARITGIESASTISLTAGHMDIVYTEGNELLSFTNIYPREEAWATKTFTLTGYNTTALEMTYDLGLNITTNTFPDTYLTYDLTLVSSTNGTPIATKTNMPINGTGLLKFGTGTFTNANGDTHNYQLKIYFKDNGEDQNDAQEAVFNASVVITERGGLTPVYNYVYNGEVQNGTSIENTQYEYRYNQEGCVGRGCLLSANRTKTNIKFLEQEDPFGGLKPLEPFIPDDGWDDGNGWQETENTGWGVRLISASSTVPVTEKMYTSINGVPITSMAHMFTGSRASSIDLSSFDTSNVTNMEGMFGGSQAETLDLSNFDTSNVTNMAYMFAESAVTTLDLSSFDMSNVEFMEFMFGDSNVSIINMSGANLNNRWHSLEGLFRNSHSCERINLSNANTSDITNMSFMFEESYATTIDMSGIDMSSVTNTAGIFYHSYASTINMSGANLNTANHSLSGLFSDCTTCSTINLSNANTSSITNMESMFYNNHATTINLTNIDTSSVTNMSGMFWNSSATSLDLSSFDTSNVTNMAGMFSRSAVTSLDLSSFDTSNVTNMAGMFSGVAITNIDLSSFDISNVIYMDQMFRESAVTTIIARNATEAARYCEVAPKNQASVYVGSTKICDGTYEYIEQAC